MAVEAENCGLGRVQECHLDRHGWDQESHITKLNLARDAKNIKKGFCRDTDQKKKAKESLW